MWEEIARETLALHLTQTAETVGETSQPLAQALHTGQELNTGGLDAARIDELEHHVTYLEVLSDAP
ncbi:hypothetical protein [Haloferax sp. ATB1]|uniref:hypothetical protein n=1 Tax=Haloferax sp. ATB1 TaxID=1508454 RepID=UPI0005B215EC|nr:hypothetical protein [Haloferax sp. ATB1]